jgi:hypothetical protein
MKRIKYKSGYKYQLHADYAVKVSIKPPKNIPHHFLNLSKDGVLLIRKGYAWDGASGITIDTPNSMRASLVHDALYQLMRMKLLSQNRRLTADKEFKRILLKDGMSGWRAGIWYKAVRRWGDSSASPKNRKKVFTAP